MSKTIRFDQWLWGSLDWLYPPVCGGCNRVGFRWCPECRQQVQKIAEPVCEICGQPLTSPGLCPACTHERPPYEALRSWLVFEGPIRSALHTLKYRRNLGLGDSLARDLAAFARQLNWPVDLLVPVPLSRQRLQERGYNQIGLVARPLAALLDWPYRPQALLRARATRSQVGLSAEERKENVAGAFTARPESVAEKTVLLIDDVATTGATLAAGADALKKAGANFVYALTLARALPHHGYQVV